MLSTAQITSAFCFFALLWAPFSIASAKRGDGIYHRLDRELVFSIGAGGGYAWQSISDQPGTALELRTLFLHTAGPAFAFRLSPDESRHFFWGMDIRPLFPALFFLNQSTERRAFDLWLQSLSFEIGGVSFLDGETDIGFSFGFGWEVPLVVPIHAFQGVWLRLGARRVLAPEQFRSGPTRQNRNEWFVYGVIAIRVGTQLGVSKWEPKPYRNK